ncbi:helix-turn-helix domain-containing protein [Nocardioides endophyticus]|uniref:Helix-turn-helix domain-containing protein n=1 Tax=Nocardioides endophyticus TaxID=1353775 RepID=A0ABP8ZCV1_9ACTN
MGDWWTPLVLQEAFYGCSRFEEFHQALGLARQTLSDRLRRLVDQGLLEKKQYQSEPVRYEYVLTTKGKDFFPVLMAMAQWGDEHLASESGPPIRYRHACGHETRAEIVCAHCAEPLTSADTQMVMGPGYPVKLAQVPAVAERFARQAALHGRPADEL